MPVTSKSSPVISTGKLTDITSSHSELYHLTIDFVNQLGRLWGVFQSYEMLYIKCYYSRVPQVTDDVPTCLE